MTGTWGCQSTERAAEILEQALVEINAAYVDGLLDYPGFMRAVADVSSRAESLGLMVVAGAWSDDDDREAAQRLRVPNRDRPQPMAGALSFVS
jgi:hypothetical protein